MKALLCALFLALTLSFASAQDLAPAVSLGGSAGVTGGLSLEGQNILTHMTDAPYTMTPAGWWAQTQIVPSTLTLTAARAITAPANGGQPFFYCNYSAGGFTVTVGASTGSTVPVPNGSCVGMHYVTGQGYVANSTANGAASVPKYGINGFVTVPPPGAGVYANTQNLGSAGWTACGYNCSGGYSGGAS